MWELVTLIRIDKMDGLERVFSPGHRYYNVLFYDKKEGKYYDLSIDMYLELSDLPRYGISI